MIPRLQLEQVKPSDPTPQPRPEKKLPRRRRRKKYDPETFGSKAVH